MENIFCLLAFAAMVAGIAEVVLGCLRWALGPLDRPAQNQKSSMQFSVADLLYLFVLVQLPVGVVHWVLLRVEIPFDALVGDSAVGIVAALVWWRSMRMLSRAGVHTVWRRCTVLTVALPGIIVGTVGMIALPCVALAYNRGWLLLAEMPVIGILYGLGRFTRAIVASSKDVVSETSCENSREPTAPGAQS
jgi:hypothetical protein